MCQGSLQGWCSILNPAIPLSFLKVIGWVRRNCGSFSKTQFLDDRTLTLTQGDVAGWLFLCWEFIFSLSLFLLGSMQDQRAILCACCAYVPGYPAVWCINLMQVPLQVTHIFPSLPDGRAHRPAAARSIISVSRWSRSGRTTCALSQSWRATAIVR